MINNEQEYRVTLERIDRFQRQVAQLRKTERNPENYQMSASSTIGLLVSIALAPGRPFAAAGHGLMALGIDR